jgi:FAD/FMN-containing dehydrogenase
MQGREGGSIKHDVSVPVANIPAFIEEGNAAARKLIPGCRPMPFGHVGDGNIHYNLVVPKGQDRLAFSRAIEAGIAHDLYALAIALGGSFSAEYGIGRFKRDLLTRYTDPTRRALMATLKHGIDPDGVMNAGAMLEDGAG